VEAAEKVTVVAPAPGAETTFDGVNPAVKPVGNPIAVSVTAALKVELGAVVSVSAREVPTGTLTELAEGVRVNVGTGATVTESDCCCFIEPLVATTAAE